MKSDPGGHIGDAKEIAIVKGPSGEVLWLQIGCSGNEVASAGDNMSHPLDYKFEVIRANHVFFSATGGARIRDVLERALFLRAYSIG